MRSSGKKYIYNVLTDRTQIILNSVFKMSEETDTSDTGDTTIRYEEGTTQDLYKSACVVSNVFPIT